MACFLLLLEYDGSDLAGWQRQARGERTVQGLLEDALRQVTAATAVVTGAGRTDAGVHAEGQLATAVVETALAPDALRNALDAVLPGDVGVLRVERRPDDFDLRRAVRSKHYRYQVWNARARSPLRARRHAHVARRLDVARMQRAAADLVGCHDFASFQAAGSSVATTHRRIDRLEVRGVAGGEIVFEVEGPGFLRHMVRNLVGTLLEVGLGRRDPDSLPGLLAARDRSLAGPTAAARGLTLVRVDAAGAPPGDDPPGSDDSA